ncbi:MAG: hypothetical protein R3C46_03440 [Hyphomonadaceae bacterium]
MPKRDVDKRKTTKALRKLRRAADRATEQGGPGLTTWEKDFVEGVSGRLEKYGSAFRDPAKGRLEEALSSRQAHVVRVIDKKSRAAASKKAGEPDKKPSGSTLSRRKPMKASAKPKWTPRVRDINDDPVSPDPQAPASRKPALKVIRGGKTGGENS